MVLIYATRPPPNGDLRQATAALTSIAWEFPAELVAQPTPLKLDEIEWLTRDGAESVEQWHFEWRGVSGSLLLIASSNWRAHHRPERCFEVHGLMLNDLHTYLVRPDLPVRFVSLGKRGSDTALSAVYWFQSADRTTDDYGARIWADLSFRRTQWMLVTILFDGAPDLSAPDLREFYIALHDAIKRHLEGGTSWASEP